MTEEEFVSLCPQSHVSMDWLKAMLHFGATLTVQRSPFPSNFYCIVLTSRMAQHTVASLFSTQEEAEAAALTLRLSC